MEFSESGIWKVLFSKSIGEWDNERIFHDVCLRDLFSKKSTYSSLDKSCFAKKMKIIELEKVWYDM